MGGLVKSVLYVTSALSLVLLAPMAAQAASDSPSQIVVTARRVQERLQDVPISISVYNQKKLADLNITYASDLATFTPSLSVNNQFGNDNSSFILRGFSQALQTAPTVGVYFAEVVAPRGGPTIQTGDGAGPGDFFDLSSVQVLKGPQGTLFGRNTTGGDVLLVPNKPTGRFGGYFEASRGNYDMQRYQGMINLPINDSIHLRIGFDRQTRNGYLKNISGIGPSDFANINYTAGRASLVLNLTPQLENYTIASFTNSDGHGTEAQMFACNPASALGVLFACPQLAAMQGHGKYVVENNQPDAHSNVHQWQVINTTTWHATQWLTVKNIASYAQLRDDELSNLFGDNFITPSAFGPLGNLHLDFVGIISPPGTFVADQSTFSEELQFQGKSLGDKLTWQVGGYFEYSRPAGQVDTIAPTLLSCSNPNALQCIDILGLLGGGTAHVGSIDFKPMSIAYRDIAGYGQATYALTDQLKLTGGFRYTYDHTIGSSNVVDYFFIGTAQDPLLPGTGHTGPSCQYTTAVLANGCLTQFHQDSEAPTWLLQLDYTPIHNLLTYVSYSRGYRAGDLTPTGGQGYNSFGPEKLDTYEVGAKTSFAWPVPGTFDVAGFDNEFTDQQIQLGLQCITKPTPPTPQNPNGTPGGQTCAVPNSGNINVGQSRIWGIELEASTQPIKGLTFEVGYTYLNSKILTLNIPAPPPDSLYNTLQPSSRVGDPLTYTPHNKATVSVNYTLPLDGSIGKISFGADYVYTDPQLIVTGDPFGEQPAYALLNLHASWNSVMGKPVDASFFMTNVTNTFYWTSVTNLFGGAGFEPRTLGEPQMFGFRLKAHFGT